MKQHASSIIIAGLAAIVYTYQAPIFWAIETLGFLGLWLVISALVIAPFTAVLGGYLRVTEWQKDKELEREIKWADVEINRAKVFAEAQKKTPLFGGGERPQLSTSSPILLADNQAEIMRGNEWLDNFCLPENNAHFFVAGPSRSGGKTTLLHYLTHRIQQPHPSAKYFILDPHAESEPDKWFTPVACSSANKAGLFGEMMEELLDQSKKKNNDVPTIFIADELGSYSRTSFKNSAVRIMEEGAKYRKHLVMAAHGITAGVNGFSVENLQNCGVIALDMIAFQYLNHASFPWRYDKDKKRVFQAQLSELNSRNNGLSLTDPRRTRFGLVSPSSGEPFVAEIPFIDKSSLQFNQKADVNNLFMLPKNSHYEIVKANKDKLRYHSDNTVVLASISEMLGIGTAGADFRISQEVAGLLLQNGDI